MSRGEAARALADVAIVAAIVACVIIALKNCTGIYESQTKLKPPTIVVDDVYPPMGVDK